MSDCLPPEIALGKTKITLANGDSFAVGLLDLKSELNEIAEKINEHNRLAREQDANAPVKTRTDYLRKVIKYVKDTYTVQRDGQSLPVALTLDEADQLDDQVEIAYAAGKKKRRGEWQAALGLPASTPESTPSS